MPQQWFKFYGGEYLYDQKIRRLTPCERSCWITLLSYASVSDIPGEVLYLDEDRLMLESGLSLVHDEWTETKGVLKKLQDLRMITVDDNGMITVLNYRKRQDSALTTYERVKKFREKKRNDNESVTDDNADDNARREENRKEEKRESDKSPALTAKDFFTNKETQKQIFSWLISTGVSEELARTELWEFIKYWKETSPKGKERWQDQKFFDIKRRIGTWMRRAK
jgi:hypothetical protein